MSQEFTRREMYDLLWSQPTRTVAANLGISDVALAKQCKKADIPLGTTAAAKYARTLLPTSMVSDRDFDAWAHLVIGSGDVQLRYLAVVLVHNAGECVGPYRRRLPQLPTLPARGLSFVKRSNVRPVVTLGSRRLLRSLL